MDLLDRTKLFILEVSTSYFTFLSRRANIKRYNKIKKYEQMMRDNNFEVNKLERKFGALIDGAKGKNFIFRKASNKNLASMETERLARKHRRYRDGHN